MGGRLRSRELPSSPPCPPCSFRTVPSQTWRSWCAPATGRTGPCRCCRCVGGRGGASWRARVRLPTPLVSFQKSIRPQVVTTFELPGCYDMWTVIAPVRKEQVGAPQVGEAWAVRGPRAAAHLARVWVAQRPPVPALALPICSSGGLGHGLALARRSGHLGLGGGIPALRLPSQEESTKGEGAEQEPSAPEADDDGRRHGFLILSREDSTMVMRPARQPGAGGLLVGAAPHPPSPTDPTDGAGDHGAGHQRLCHAGPHSLCWQHRGQSLHRASVATRHPPVGRRWARPHGQAGWGPGLVRADCPLLTSLCPQ